MAKNTSVTLGEHFEGFIADQIASGRYESKSETIRAAMRLLEERERKVAALRQAIDEGEQSGYVTGFNMDEIIAEAKAEAASTERDA